MRAVLIGDSAAIDQAVAAAEVAAEFAVTKVSAVVKGVKDLMQTLESDTFQAILATMSAFANFFSKIADAMEEMSFIQDILDTEIPLPWVEAFKRKVGPGSCDSGMTSLPACVPKLFQ